MRVCLISTYPPTECGIATYTQYLCEELKSEKKEVIVVSQVGASGEQVFPVYTPSDNDISAKLFHTSAKLTPDVIHVQHEYGLYGSDHGIQIVDFLLRCKLAGIPTVMTLHTVYDELKSFEETILSNILENSGAVIVHEEYQKETLIRYFPQHKEKLHVIPHGVRELKKEPKAKELLGLSGKKVILLAGYFRPTKRFDRMVSLFPKIAEQMDDVVLLVAGKMRGVDAMGYQTYFFDLINNSPAKDKMKVLRGQFPQHTFDTIMSAADVIVMPYDVGAQSGILAHSSAFQVPAVTSDLLSFKLWCDESKGGLTSANDDEYVENIVKILSDDTFAAELSNNVKEYNKNRLWGPIAKDHMKVYESVITVPYGEAEYFYVPED